MEQAEYVLITPARNEEDYIEKTILSVVQQSILPRKWVIVSDNSTDLTDKIVKKYAKQYDFIQLLRVDGQKNKSFGAKVRAFRRGYQEVQNLDFIYVGNLDADISFEDNYYEKILVKFNNNPKLGIAGGIRFELLEGKWVRELSSPWSVCAGVQLFRRVCYDDIGGYTFENRGEDTIAELTARMRGWKVCSYDDVHLHHHRPVDKTSGNIIGVRFAYGVHDYRIGYLPLYAFIKSINKLKEKPYVVSSFLRLTGYFWGFLIRKKRLLPEDVIAFQREEQKERLLSVFGLR